MRAPILDEVLAHVRPGRHVHLRFWDDERRRATATGDGVVLRRVMCALLDARYQVNPQTREWSFPLTPRVLQAVALLIGAGYIGIKRCRALLNTGRNSGLLQDAGSYRKWRPPRRVPVYRLGARIVGLGKGVGNEHLRLPPKQPTGDRRSPVKATVRRRWWDHGLFGMPGGESPPLPSGKRMEKLWARDETRGGALVKLRSVTVDGVVVLA